MEILTIIVSVLGMGGIISGLLLRKIDQMDQKQDRRDESRVKESVLIISGLQAVGHLSEATASITTCSTLSSYLGIGLETAYGVPFIRSLQPHGIIGYEDLFRKLAKLVNKEAELEVYLQEERETYLPQIEKIKQKLSV